VLQNAGLCSWRRTTNADIVRTREVCLLGASHHGRLGRVVARGGGGRGERRDGGGAVELVAGVQRAEHAGAQLLQALARAQRRQPRRRVRCPALAHQPHHLLHRLQPTPSFKRTLSSYLHFSTTKPGKSTKSTYAYTAFLENNKYNLTDRKPGLFQSPGKTMLCICIKIMPTRDNLQALDGVGRLSCTQTHWSMSSIDGSAGTNS